ncbi:hypothetical protein NHP21011_14440 [Helicobacter heilmannii]|nr:hypothetical protein NHP21011_14440 [Helicobacter heilmannii]
MNTRIEFLRDQNHTIGHSRFLGLESLEGLQNCFKDKNISLLHEYFHDDYAKVHTVLNRNGMLASKEMGSALSGLLGDFIDTDKKCIKLQRLGIGKPKYSKPFMEVFTKIKNKSHSLMHRMRLT